ncbi:glycosyltransferase family 29 protein [Pararoseomonas indoligenes]|uniref:Glycosyltransferase family 29 protein n=1 Tax=Roseomonas indoligenes TaxID=2820811 RepID=A0A940MYH5_9PROT|nr:glycosyltransferase family 29 protein [Pararoseomonas indoligenes]MBP0495694.1 glycosyltransferase family 29 protein [Pararoseomonas indoligenes]
MRSARQEAEAALEAGETERAASLFEMIYRSRPGPLAAENLAKTDLAMGRVTRVESLLEDALVLWPDRTRLLGLYLRLDEQTGGFKGVPDRVRAKLQSSFSHPGLNARAAIAAAWEGRESDLKRYSKTALKFVHPTAAPLLRSILMSAAIEGGFVSWADRLAGMARTSEETHPDIIVDRITVRLKMEILDDETSRLLFWLRRHPRHLEKADYMAAMYSWEKRGVSSDLVEVLLGLTPTTTIRLHALSMSAELGDWKRALEIYRQDHAIREHWRKWLPVSKLVASESDDSAIQAHAGLYDTIRSNTCNLARRLANPALRIAVVGNSPCERGLSKGQAIDEHDEVFRFNQYSIAEKYQADYGSKTTIVSRLRLNDANFSVLSPGMTILLKRPHFLHQPADWSRALEMSRAGIVITSQPLQPFYELAGLLGSPPSSGIAICYLLKTLRGTLERKNFFGFSFVGQVDPGTTHYTGKGLARSTHNWEREAELFTGLFG